MGAVVAAKSLRDRGVDPPSAVRERLEAFAGEVLAEAMNRPVQLINGGLYLRGLLEEGARKSLEPMVARLGGSSQARQGQPLELWFDPQHLQLFDPETGRSLLAGGQQESATSGAPAPA